MDSVTTDNEGVWVNVRLRLGAQRALGLAAIAGIILYVLWVIAAGKGAPMSDAS